MPMVILADALKIFFGAMKIMDVQKQNKRKKAKMNPLLIEALKEILVIAIPAIKNLIESQVVPRLKRLAYEHLDAKVDDLINDLAQNASKIKTEDNEAKKLAYTEGTKLGLETIRAIADKLNQAADTIEKEIN